MQKIVLFLLSLFVFLFFTPYQAIARTNRVDPVCVASNLELLSTSDIDKQLPLMQQAGINWVRFDFPWKLVESTQGVWDFSQFDYIYNSANAKGIKIIALMPQYDAPAWYLGTNPWDTPIDPTSYAMYVKAVATHFKGKILLYELGNEPNYDTFWYPVRDPQAYTNLLQTGYPAIKAADPAAKVISAGLTPDHPEDFLTSMYADGVKGSFDYLGYHPYSWPVSPDDTTNYRTFSQIANLKQIMTNNGDNKNIMATEDGWPSTVASGGVDEITQANYITRVYQKIEHENYQYVSIACVYDFIDHGTDPANPEYNFGLLRFDYSQKPSFASMSAIRSNYNVHFRSINP